jgi:hypothetical protein
MKPYQPIWPCFDSTRSFQRMDDTPLANAAACPPPQQLIFRRPGATGGCYNILLAEEGES